ncbi:MAG TPA: hypothetical protein PKW33_19495 [Anaerolineaceae bacterium]|nr:hypothetical protein [Anaerolineaceae bacterium]HPN53789.1 hypothetical protein [Anaerolineaceae bacterium]
MRQWSLQAGQPLSLTISSDFTFSQIDYLDDQIWELTLGSGEPPAVNLQTSYGLRAKMMRVFPRFTDLASTMPTPVNDPGEFAGKVEVLRFFPNYLLIHYKPFPYLDVTSDYRVPGPHQVAGTFVLVNGSEEDQKLTLEMAVILVPQGEGSPMTGEKDGRDTFLAGRSGDLYPVFIWDVESTAGTGAYPGLSVEVSLPAGGKQRLTWALVTGKSMNASREEARQIIEIPKEAEVLRWQNGFERKIVDIYTGNPDWDAALAFSQKIAYSLFLKSDDLPDCSFVMCREPERGFSPQGDGRDYDHLWNGQSGLEAYYLSSLIFPGGRHLVKGLIRNFLASQGEDGVIDCKPGLAGQRGRFPVPPLLASLAWQASEMGADIPFLQEVYQPLQRNLETWFKPERDRDEDGFPEWDHWLSAGFEDNFSQECGQQIENWVNLSTAESPALAGLLIREIKVLAKIRDRLGIKTSKDQKLYLSRLRSGLDKCWNEPEAAYRYIDRDTHRSPQAKYLAGLSEGMNVVKEAVGECERLMLVLFANEPNPGLKLFIHGECDGHPVLEQVLMPVSMWMGKTARNTSQRTYSRIEQVEVQGLREGDKLELWQAGYEGMDISLLLPLWAHAPTRPRVERMVKEHPILSTTAAYGLPASLGRGSLIHLPWVQLVVEGLIEYGLRKEAAAIMERTLDGIALHLRTKRAFFQAFDAYTGEVSGERNHLAGLAPVGLFLDVLGVRILSTEKVIITGSNPFKFEVKVHFAGLTIIRREKQTVITFPDGQSTFLTDSTSPRIVTLA